MSSLGFISSIFTTTKTLWKGITITLRHFFQAKQQRKPLGIADKDYFNQQNGLFTTQYPHEAIPMPDNGRNRLNNEIDDCIVCDLCAKICPVDCIEIEAVKSTEEIGTTSDGSLKRLYAAKFDIDLAKCCYCGLCTTVCPTECLTMTNAFDYSEVNVTEMLYHYSNLSPAEVVEKKELLAEAQKLKAEQKLAKQVEKPTLTEQSSEIAATKQAFKPTFKPSVPKIEPPKNEPLEADSDKEDDAGSPKPNPVFKPVFKPSLPKIEPPKNEASETDSKKEEDAGSPKPKPVFKPVFKPTLPKIEPPKNEASESDSKKEDDAVSPKPKPVFKPVFKPSTPKVEEPKNDELKNEASETDSKKEDDAVSSKAKFVFKPTIKPKLNNDIDNNSSNNS